MSVKRGKYEGNFTLTGTQVQQKSTQILFATSGIMFTYCLYSNVVFSLRHCFFILRSHILVISLEVFNICSPTRWMPTMSAIYRGFWALSQQRILPKNVSLPWKQALTAVQIHQMQFTIQAWKGKDGLMAVKIMFRAMSWD